MTLPSWWLLAVLLLAWRSEPHREQELLQFQSTLLAAGRAGVVAAPLVATYLPTLRTVVLLHSLCIVRLVAYAVLLRQERVSPVLVQPLPKRFLLSLLTSLVYQAPSCEQITA